MCQPRMSSPHAGSTGCTCGCCGCGCGPGFRRFFSAQEERERLESYRNQLKKELAGVEECIEECECK
jgi:hypothetical protein